MKLRNHHDILALVLLQLSRLKCNFFKYFGFGNILNATANLNIVTLISTVWNFGKHSSNVVSTSGILWCDITSDMNNENK